MKTLEKFGILVLAAGALFFTSCSETESIDESLALADKSVEFAAICQDSCTFDEELTDADIEGLLLMREEEKLAHDVYMHFYGVYGQQIFLNIANSEQSHMDAVLVLLDGYGIDDSALGGEGEFSNETLAELYAQLIDKGSASLAEALKVGATVEDLDIYDLKGLLSETENTDIIRVYENLLQGSENHMRGFVRNLEALGESYTPQFISVEEFEAILAGSSGQAYGAGGNGYGNGGQRNGQGGSSGYNTADGDCDGTGTSSTKGNQGGRQNGKQGS
ncbi:DUF2202 domain-containing protein [uncultured Draconibacterium sp.]|uniref:DUF2202 domain-containing protein n=1 Tax=uncultured Draconibacterium sp. TaxID=1573823 RepID=UPI002AA91245|nr:DUF2202 domain-containing protein [uncultured Draconibacterium sp.]